MNRLGSVRVDADLSGISFALVNAVNWEKGWIERGKVLALAIALILALPSSRCFAGDMDASCIRAQARDARPVLPSNVFAPEFIRRLLCKMLKRSASFRRQCCLLGEARHLRITIHVVAGVPGSHCRALSQVTRYAYGYICVRIFLVAARRDYVEVIAHEFEHALEQVEGVDLRVLARVAGAGVYHLGDGSFETERAMRAGQIVAREFYSSDKAEPARAASAH
jgi:hypothetical protein